MIPNVLNSLSIAQGDLTLSGAIAFPLVERIASQRFTRDCSIYQVQFSASYRQPAPGSVLTGIILAITRNETAMSMLQNTNIILATMLANESDTGDYSLSPIVRDFPEEIKVNADDYLAIYASGSATSLFHVNGTVLLNYLK